MTDHVPSPSPQRIGILVVDDHEIVRRGLRQMIEVEPDLSVCAEAGNSVEALRAIEREQPALVILDLTLGGEDGLELLKTIKLRRPELPVLVVSMRDESLYVERVLRANASGYVMKSAPSGQIVAAIRSILSGDIALSPTMSARLLRGFIAGRKPDCGDPVANLSDRELHVFQMIGVGMACREIAEKLGISQRTAETHRENIKNKLCMDSSLALTRYAIEWVRQAGT